MEHPSSHHHKGLFAFVVGTIAALLFFSCSLQAQFPPPPPPMPPSPPRMGPPPGTEPGRVRVCAPSLNVREGPSVDAPVISKVFEGTILVVHRGEGGWLHIAGPRGITGWVSASLTTPAR